MIKNISNLLLCILLLSVTSTASASPSGSLLDLTGEVLSDENVKIAFRVDAPWKILEGTAEQIMGKMALATNGTADSIRANLAVQKLQYKAGLRAAGQMIAAWLRANPPTPAKLSIGKTSLPCTPESLSAQGPCRGTIDGQLTIWAKEYNIDIPVELHAAEEKLLLTGVKKIKWGEYGFGDPSSSISKLQPVVELSFSIEVPPIN
jgi:hypothetical protein